MPQLEDRKLNKQAAATPENGEETTCSVRVIHKEVVARAADRMKSENDYRRLSEVFRLLGDPTRLKIVDALSLEELCVCDLSHLLGASESAVSHQLRLLRAAEIVNYRKEGRIVYYSLADEHIVDIIKNAWIHARKG